ncbi:MAG TPA: AraC family transcriptional regulator [Candidatus Limnocylindrales bacterium]|nr:AraC family transcriptional regulator [Candidatus Limnocylindrales bacterium]
MKAWTPAVPGITEVFHAHFVDHVYPLHTHDTWTLLIVDDGAIRYGLERAQHGALRPGVTLLPPHVPHDGRAATRDGFRKRVLYLDSSTLDDRWVGAAVGSPALRDEALRDRVHRLHLALARPGDELEAESRLAFVRERLLADLGARPARPLRAGAGVAGSLRELLDESLVEGITLRQAATRLQCHPTHLVRAFSARFGLPPHAYLTGRRVDAARRLLLQGRPAAEVAVAVGFYDQSHLTRHFKRHLATTPARFATCQ